MITNLKRYLMSHGWVAIAQSYANTEINIEAAQLVTDWLRGVYLSGSRESEAERIMEQAIDDRGGGITMSQLSDLADIESDKISPISKYFAESTGVSVAFAASQLLADESLRADVSADFERSQLEESAAIVGVDAFSVGV